VYYYASDIILAMVLVKKNCALIGSLYTAREPIKCLAEGLCTVLEANRFRMTIYRRLGLTNRRHYINQADAMLSTNRRQYLPVDSNILLANRSHVIRQ